MNGSLCLHGLEFADDTRYPAAPEADASPLLHMWHAGSYHPGGAAAPSVAVGRAGTGDWMVEVHETSTGQLRAYYAGQPGEFENPVALDAHAFRPRVAADSSDTVIEVHQGQPGVSSLVPGGARRGHRTARRRDVGRARAVRRGLPSGDRGVRQTGGRGGSGQSRGERIDVADRPARQWRNGRVEREPVPRDLRPQSHRLDDCLYRGRRPGRGRGAPGRRHVRHHVAARRKLEPGRDRRVEGPSGVRPRRFRPSRSSARPSSRSTRGSSNGIPVDEGDREIGDGGIVRWGTSSKYDEGGRPAIAADLTMGTGIEAHEGGAGFGPLWGHDVDVY